MLVKMGLGALGVIGRICGIRNEPVGELLDVGGRGVTVEHQRVDELLTEVSVDGSRRVGRPRAWVVALVIGEVIALKPIT